MEQALPDPRPRRFTVQEYLAFEADAPTRHEFRDGEIIDMAGAEPDHTRIVRNTSRRLDERLDGTDCELFMLDQRVLTDYTRYTYPDVTVACHPLEYDPHARPRTLVNPRVIIEVLSPSTESTDRGEKFRRYIRLPSLQEYVLIAQDQPRVETIYRHPEGMWAFAPWAEGLEATLHIRTLRIDIPLSQIYAGVAFPPSVDGEPG